MDDKPDYKALSRGVSNDLSSEAIAERIKIAGELWRLGTALMRSEYAGKVEPAPKDPDGLNSC